MENELFSGAISAEEFFCLMLTSEPTPEKARLKIDQFIKKVQLTHPHIHESLKRVNEEYFHNDFHALYPDEKEEYEIALALSLKDTNINKHWVNDSEQYNKREEQVKVNNNEQCKREDKVKGWGSQGGPSYSYTSNPDLAVGFSDENPPPGPPPGPKPPPGFGVSGKENRWSNHVKPPANWAKLFEDTSGITQENNKNVSTSDKTTVAQDSPPGQMVDITGDETRTDNHIETSGEGKTKKRRNRGRRKGDLGSPVIYWFRRDLRLYDNPALEACASDFNGSPVIPVFLWNDEEEGPLAAGGATKIWLHKSLPKLDESLSDNYTSRLILRKTVSYSEELCNLVRETGARNVVITALYEPYLAKRDYSIIKKLEKMNVQCHQYHSYLLHRPDQVQVNGVGFRGMGSVLHFLDCCKTNPGDPIGKPIDKPKTLPIPQSWPKSHTLDDLQLNKMPRRKDGSIIDWAKEMRDTWEAGEEAGYTNLMEFINVNLQYYEQESARSDQKWTAVISPYVHFGELSPRTILHEAHGRSKKFRRKLAWRDLSYWLLYLFPDMDRVSIRPPYELQRWNYSKTDLKAWQKGYTGFPLVDAAMRQLWRVGWINNYMRHVVASFLISYLHITWVEGYNWFQDTLLDADVAINAMMWQNGGMSGIDHWNFVMHPVDAAHTCDPNGDYVRKWVPELAGLPNENIHQPWKCPQFILNENKVVLGKTYPNRLVIDLRSAREQSLADVTLLRQKHGRGYIDQESGNDMVQVPKKLLERTKLNGQRIMIPIITRKEFKFRLGRPDLIDQNPYDPVLKGYVSRSRDELIAHKNTVDFTASTINEGIARQERYEKAVGIYRKDEDDQNDRRRTRRRAPLVSVAKGKSVPKP